jgi:hypothetical protein
MKSIALRIAEELGVAERQVTAAVELLDGGATVPFVARYRKEATGALDDTQLRTLDERLRYLRELEDRRKQILDSIDSQGKLDDPLRAKIMEAESKARLEDIVLTTRVDGMQHRLIRNEVLGQFEQAGPARLLLAALHNAWQLKQRTGASIAELLHAARQMQREGGLTFGQALMAANSPVLLQRSMIEGQPAEGIMATGTVAGVIGDLPSCAELVERIVREAEQRLAALAAGRYGKQDV